MSRRDLFSSPDRRDVDGAGFGTVEPPSRSRNGRGGLLLAISLISVAGLGGVALNVYGDGTRDDGVTYISAPIEGYKERATSDTSGATPLGSGYGDESVWELLEENGGPAPSPYSAPYEQQADSGMALRPAGPEVLVEDEPLPQAPLFRGETQTAGSIPLLKVPSDGRQPSVSATETGREYAGIAGIDTREAAPAAPAPVEIAPAPANRSVAEPSPELEAPTTARVEAPAAPPVETTPAIAAPLAVSEFTPRRNPGPSAPTIAPVQPAEALTITNEPSIAAADERDYDSPALPVMAGPSSSVPAQPSSVVPPPAVAAAPGASGFAAQLASFGDGDTAREALGQFFALSPDLTIGFDLFIKETDMGANGTYHQLRVGGFTAFAEAEQYCGQWRSRGQDCQVVAR